MRGPETGVLMFLLAGVLAHACAVLRLIIAAVLFMLEVNNSNEAIRTARGAISGSDSMM